MMCNCIDETNQALVDMGSNTELDIPILIDFTTGETGASQSVLVATRKHNDKDRRKPTYIFASYCPFCGVKYSPDPPPPESSQEEGEK